MNFDQLFDSLEDIKIGVIGDVMLDSYIWGKVERISPEAPVPVVTIDQKNFRIGGAGNVALNVRSLGATVSILSVMGADEDGNQLRRLFQQEGIDTNFLLTSAKRITTNKTRIISRNQQMMRLDSEMVQDLGYEDENRLVLAAQTYIAQEKPDVIIFEDYNKGALTELVIRKIIDLCKVNNIPTAVDPKRRNFFSYSGVSIFKPNLKEARDALNIIRDDVDDKLLFSIHEQLSARLQHDISFVTLSEKGVFYQQQDRHRWIGSHLRNIADVSGAGDTVIAVASLIFAATRNMDLAAEIANIAGGLVCEEVGTVAIDRDKLLNECKVLLPGYSSISQLR